MNKMIKILNAKFWKFLISFAVSLFGGIVVYIVLLPLALAERGCIAFGGGVFVALFVVYFGTFLINWNFNKILTWLYKRTVFVKDKMPVMRGKTE